MYTVAGEGSITMGMLKLRGVGVASFDSLPATLLRSREAASRDRRGETGERARRLVTFDGTEGWNPSMLSSSGLRRRMTFFQS